MISTLACLTVVYAQGPYRYRVTLADKNSTEYSLSHPEAFLSEKAIQRRAWQGVEVDSTDLPVCRSYINKVVEKGVSLVHTSKWNNTLLVECADTTSMEEVMQLPFVTAIKKVWTRSASEAPAEDDRKKQITDDWVAYGSYYGAASYQVEMLNVDKLHKEGFTGKGLTIAVIDGGFLNVDAVKMMKGVHIEGTRNFVRDESVYERGSHGLKVLSCMAVNTPYGMVGTAPDASYWLLCSEDNDVEMPVEEDYWAAAVEFADSVGVDMINTSLGYSTFDDSACNYTYSQLDGHTSLMSRSADMAGRKGIVVVCSAGNEGNKKWKKITIPADAEHVITVGAVDRDGSNTLFSSVGNTADGRIKPDVMALGGRSGIVNEDGTTDWANGTSFAAPILCGAVACLWQACPRLTAAEITDLVRKAGDRADSPDNIYGYGIPDFWKAYQMGLQWENKTSESRQTEAGE